MLGAKLLLSPPLSNFIFKKLQNCCLIPKMVRVHKTGVRLGQNKVCHLWFGRLGPHCPLTLSLLTFTFYFHFSILTFTFTKLHRVTVTVVLSKMVRVYKTGVCWGLNFCYHHHCLLSLSQNCTLVSFPQDGQSEYDRGMLGAQQGLSFVVWSSGPSCILCIA